MGVILSSILIGLLIPYSNNSNREANKFPLHVNPDTVRTEVDPYSLAQFYIQGLNGIINPVEYNLTQIMELSKSIDVPPSIKYIMNRLNGLMVKLNDEINSTENHVEVAKKYIDHKDFRNALNEINRAKYWDIHANMTLNELINVFNEFHNTIIKYKFNERIEKSVDELKKLENEIIKLQYSLNKLIKESEESSSIGIKKYFTGADTHLTINVTPSSSVIGGNVYVSGRLYTDSGPLPNRTVYFLIENENYTTNTDLSGRYDIKLAMPYLYKNTTQVYVYYVPNSSDIGLYNPSSNKTMIKLLYYKTRINLKVDKISYPGLPINITAIIYPSSNVPRSILIFMDGKLIASYNTSSNILSTEYELPSNMTLGPHMISAYVSPYKEYSSYKTYAITTVLFMDIKLDVKISPEPVTYPLSNLKIYGYIADIRGKPVSNTLVEFDTTWVDKKIYTDSLGRFSVNLGSPPALSSTSIKIVVKPTQPWYGDIIKTVNVTVVNLYVISLALLIIVGVSISVIRREKFKEIEKPRGIRREYYKEKKIDRESIREERIRRIENNILDYYNSIVNLTSKFAGPPKKYETLREYYKRVYKMLGDVANEFWGLTLLAEYTLYSGNPIYKEDIDKAKGFYENIKRVFHE